VVHAKNFTAGFPHIGQHGIHNILNQNNIKLAKKTIIQASDLKEKLEHLQIKHSNCTIISFDAECMYLHQAFPSTISTQIDEKLLPSKTIP
jgi:hypothetical protein